MPILVRWMVLRIEFAYGWGIVRASLLVHYLVARFEANSEDELQQVKSTFKELLQRTYDVVGF